MTLVRSYLRGNLSPSIRTLSLTEFRQVAEALEGETIAITASEIISVLRQYADGRVNHGDLRDWIRVLSWGNHPQAIVQQSWPQEGGAAYTHKTVMDDAGVKKLDIAFDDRCRDQIVENIRDLEDRIEGGSVLSPPEVEAYISRLSGCE